MELSKTKLDALNGKSREKTEIFKDRDGLGARVSPKGKVTFQVRYTLHKKRDRVDIGTYPLMTLKEARDKALEVKTLASKGRDPKVEKAKTQQAAAQTPTVESLFSQWYEADVVGIKKMDKEIKRSFEIHVFPVLGRFKANEVTRAMWMELLDELRKSYTSITDRVLTNSKQMLSWAVDREMIEVNPIADVSAAKNLGIYKSDSGDERHLADWEIQHSVEYLRKGRIEEKNKIFLKLCIFWGCRHGELRKAERDHFDFEEMTWTIPPFNHKTGHQKGRKIRGAIVRPIIPEIVPLLKRAFEISPSEKWVFCNSGTANVLGDKAPKAYPYNIMQWCRRHKGVEMEHWHMNDLRHTARTNFSALTSPFIAEVMVAHAVPAMQKRYDHYKYLREQAEAYSLWYQRLVKLTSQEDWI